MKHELQELNYYQKDYNEYTYHRRGVQASSLDHIFMNFETEVHITTRRTNSSDHHYLEVEIIMDNSPYKT